MKLVALVNTHLGPFPVKAGQEIPAWQAEQKPQQLEDLIKAGFVAELTGDTPAAEADDVEKAVEKKPKKKKE